MSYLVFARKYRPKSFKEIIGQEHITITLANAIKKNRIAHSFLFTGPRGTGKTSTARILSMSLNCESGPKEDPCQKCTNCIEIQKGINPDVIEIDGASNRGIDQIRELKENIFFSPIRSKYKIYIIDEVHMLTREAFNALLKILEEPPTHVIFIFATTEPHKLPETIISRCQRFDFRRLTILEITNQLKRISHNEKIDIDEDALLKIANLSDGCLRDAEGFLDKAFSFSEDKITTDTVNRLSGIPDFSIFKALLKYINEKNSSGISNIVNKIYNSGYDISLFLQQLIKLYRIIYQLKLSNNRINEFSDDVIKSLNEYTNYSEISLIATINTLFEIESNIKYTPISSIYLEIKLIFISNLDKFIDIDTYIINSEDLQIRNYEPIKKKNEHCDNNNISNNNVIPISNPNKWDDFLKYVDDNSPLLHPFLIDTHLVSIDKNVISILTKNEIHKDMLIKNYAGNFQKLINQFFSGTYKIVIGVSKGVSENIEKEDKNLDLIKKVFNAEIEEIRRDDD
ncbi:DNA polymerase III subunit gamma/tau [candidate division TA06 bacterium]|uniref:DNA polymerase III subunit gamma/tau n=1 Tax=candidate division TA06 bacterium TaxID=2250710 RepID=A0A660SGI6_UNCT6|nr:MAG: DNA polymerase III subunit gamma/tau [candidate division TA06 bacterium]